MAADAQVQSLVVEQMELARALAARYDRPGVDADALESEAMLALVLAAQEFDPGRNPYGDDGFPAYARYKIRTALRAHVREIRFGFLKGVPVRLRRAALKCHQALGCLQARGILRPSAEQIAGEAQLSVEQVVLVLAIPSVLVRQPMIEWAQDHGAERAFGEPELWPAFGPLPGFTPDRPCQAIHPTPIPKGSLLCCMACHRSGVDGHRALKRSKATDPKPETKAGPAPKPQPVARLTRKEKRQMLFGPRIEPMSSATETQARIGGDA